jgi:hypothetical protein
VGEEEIEAGVELEIELGLGCTNGD